MGRAPCCDKANVKRGPWSPDEDDILRNYLEKHGTGGNWIALPHKAGLRRCGKSCRLRWLNYLRPDIKHGGFTPEEDNIICSLYSSIGSRWSIIASHLPGRTDNDVKNYWNTKLKKKLPAGKIGVAVFNKSSNHESSTSNLSSGQFSASVPIEAGVEARVDQGNSDDYYNLKANGSTSLSYTTDMKHQQIYGYCQIEEFPLPGLMEVPDRYSNNYSIMSSSQEASSRLSNSPSFPMENINFATHWSVKDEGADEDQGNILTDLDFKGPPYVSSGSSFQEESSHEVIPCFGIFPSTTSLANGYYW